MSEPNIDYPGDYFHPGPGPVSLRARLPLPPADNQLCRNGRFNRYATAEYRDWLELARGQLVPLLEGWAPDAERWWSVRGTLCLGVGDRDPANHLKASLDLLSGAWAPRKDVKEGGVVLYHANKVYRGGLLWNDDCRATLTGWDVLYTRFPEPCVVLEVRERAAPADWRARQEQAAQQAREQQKAAELATRTITAPPAQWEQFLALYKAEKSLSGFRSAVRKALAAGGAAVTVTATPGQWQALRAVGFVRAAEYCPEVGCREAAGEENNNAF